MIPRQDLFAAGESVLLMFNRLSPSAFLQNLQYINFCNGLQNPEKEPSKSSYSAMIIHDKEGPKA